MINFINLICWAIDCASQARVATSAAGNALEDGATHHFIAFEARVQVGRVRRDVVGPLLDPGLEADLLAVLLCVLRIARPDDGTVARKSDALEAVDSEVERKEPDKTAFAAA